MRCVAVLAVFLSSLIAVGRDKPVSCELSERSILSRSPAGIAQVSNLGGVEMKCTGPARPRGKPGDFQAMFAVTTAAYQIFPDGTKKLVSSEVKTQGGGTDGSVGKEYADIILLIPLPPAEREAAVRAYLMKMFKAVPKEAISAKAFDDAVTRMQDEVYESRVGRFRVECFVLDGRRVIGEGTVEFEVLFKGRFSEYGFFGAPPS